jgi:ERCC4-type nuclease
MILLDSREGSKELAAFLPSGSYELTYLEAGDAAFLGHGPDGPMTYPIAVERKAVYDLFESFKTGRLNTQIQKMSGMYRQIYLVIEGKFRVNKDTKQIMVPRNGEWKETRLTYDVIDNYLNTLVDERHIKLKYSHNLQETAWQVFNLYTHCSTEKHSSHLKLDTTWEVNPYMPASFEKRVAAQLDHIGSEKAGLAAERFSSARAMANATEEEWKQIKGIGPVVAKSIVNQWNKKRS